MAWLIKVSDLQSLLVDHPQAERVLRDAASYVHKNKRQSSFFSRPRGLF